MTFTISKVAESPDLITKEVVLTDGEKVIFRPLNQDDINKLTEFLQGLSVETRRFSTFEGYDTVAAKELCDAINKYDKLRFVVENNKERIVGLIELSFGIPQGDIERFARSRVTLDEETDCRFGPTFADDYQSKGLGSEVFPIVEDIVKKFGKVRVILWGGVLADNERAIKYYKKFGFRDVGKYIGSDGVKHLDMILDLS